MLVAIRRLAAANGRSAADVTEWVRSMDRPLLDSQAYLKAGEAANEIEQNSVEREAIPGALPFED